MKGCWTTLVPNAVGIYYIRNLNGDVEIVRWDGEAIWHIGWDIASNVIAGAEWWTVPIAPEPTEAP